MGCERGAEVLLATFGEKGSLAYDGRNFYRQKCLASENLVNTVGAGDSYGSAFYGWNHQGRGYSGMYGTGSQESG
mgnify:CR=1 FL=1